VIAKPGQAVDWISFIMIEQVQALNKKIISSGDPGFSKYWFKCGVGSKFA
jgi:hypothetical protein